MPDKPATYVKIAEAEKAIIEASYVRDNQRHVWVQPDTGKIAKVVRANNSQFSVQWG